MKNVDLKQLALFCELIECQSLTEAAARMNVTPSAASQALTRLRSVLNDALYVREHQRYQLTPFAENAIASFHEMIDLWNDVSSSEGDFDPRACESHIVVSCYDSFGEASLAELYRSVMAAAPRLSLDIQSPVNGPQDVKELREGGVDVVCSHYEPPTDARDLHMETVKRFELTHCCLNVDHPRIGQTLSLEQYQAEEHLLITFLRRHGGQRSPIDLELERLGFKARRASIVNSWLLCAELLGSTHRLVTTSRQQAAMLQRSNPRIRTLPLPAELSWPTMPVNMIWHPRTHNSRPHRWLRLQLREYLAPCTVALESPVLAEPAAQPLSTTLPLARV
ncbi:MAG: LysR family transcriptional regulator [Hydrogenophaga sp.]|jgi:DNA-binding transcriptional LysR family regulator|uniref:LysR family transcriptional regulator n=1 Tax=Hydrogenophaga sp. TaxID=1904254 RepID=UPI001D99C010|nr:LysR family transcriptional regulator [Hydrogenophaga sp.]MBW0172781.1 LysR family transcriptional regulator [Hydrogenophaga sp.]MBW0185699.1 LysR family transcriptional regulator [Hydrogenophaga sp.]